MKFGILFLSPFISNKQQTNGITRTVTHPIQLKNFIFESRKVIDLEIWAKNVRMLESWEGRLCSSFLHNFITFPLRTCSVLPDLATYHTWDGRKMKRRIHKKIPCLLWFVHSAPSPIISSYVVPFCVVFSDQYLFCGVFAITISYILSLSECNFLPYFVRNCIENKNERFARSVDPNSDWFFCIVHLFLHIQSFRIHSKESNIQFKVGNIKRHYFWNLSNHRKHVIFSDSLWTIRMFFIKNIYLPLMLLCCTETFLQQFAQLAILNGSQCNTRCTSYG